MQHTKIFKEADWYLPVNIQHQCRVFYSQNSKCLCGEHIRIAFTDGETEAQEKLIFRGHTAELWQSKVTMDSCFLPLNSLIS